MPPEIEADEEERPSDPVQLQIWLLGRQVRQLSEKVIELTSLVHRLQAEVEDRRPLHR